MFFVIASTSMYMNDDWFAIVNHPPIQRMSAAHVDLLQLPSRLGLAIAIATGAFCEFVVTRIRMIGLDAYEAAN